MLYWCTVQEDRAKKMISGGFEPPTAAVLRLRSTPELRNHDRFLMFLDKTFLICIYFFIAYVPNKVAAKSKSCSSICAAVG